MIHAFIPHYDIPEDRFMQSLKRQTVPVDKHWFYDRFLTKVYWTDSINFFRRWLELYPETFKDTDVICILNSDLDLDPKLMEKGSKVKPGEILIPKVYENNKLDEWGLTIDWSKKRFYQGHRIDCFSPRGIFITVKDFRESGGFNPLLPHYLADYEWAIRQIRRGLKPHRMNSYVIHQTHSKSAPIFSPLNPHNPKYWVIFLWLVCPKKYLLINIIKSLISAWRHRKDKAEPKKLTAADFKYIDDYYKYIRGEQ